MPAPNIVVGRCHQDDWLCCDECCGTYKFDEHSLLLSLTHVVAATGAPIADHEIEIPMDLAPGGPPYEWEGSVVYNYGGGTVTFSATWNCTDDPIRCTILHNGDPFIDFGAVGFFACPEANFGTFGTDEGTWFGVANT